MPIYAYKCDSCGFAKDVLQKISDAPLSECPSCGVGTFRKQVTAAGFQLKGSGWYVTDFRGGNNAGAAAKSDDKPADAGAKADGAKADGGTDSAAAKGASSPAAPAPSAAPAADSAPKKSATPPSTGSGS